MSIVRPRAAAILHRWREPIAAGGAALIGVWIGTRGGWFLFGVGVAIWIVAGGWALIALRRLRFGGLVDAPGAVEVVEGQIGYFGPNFGGFVAIADLAEIGLSDMAGRRSWRLRTLDGGLLTIPVGATGSERLFDAFSQVPGIDTGALAHALASPEPSRTLWRRASGHPARLSGD